MPAHPLSTLHVLQTLLQVSAGIKQAAAVAKRTPASGKPLAAEAYYTDDEDVVYEAAEEAVPRQLPLRGLINGIFGNRL
jgi:hypothetical protein